MSQARCLMTKLCLEPFSAGRTTMTLNPYVPLPIMARANNMKEVPSVDCRWNCNRFFFFFSGKLFFFFFILLLGQGKSDWFWDIEDRYQYVLQTMNPQDCTAISAAQLTTRQVSDSLTALSVCALVLSKKPPWRDDNQPWIHSNELWIVWNDSGQWADYTAGLF